VRSRDLSFHTPIHHLLLPCFKPFSSPPLTTNPNRLISRQSTSYPFPSPSVPLIHTRYLSLLLHNIGWSTFSIAPSSLLRAVPLRKVPFAALSGRFNIEIPLPKSSERDKFSICKPALFVKPASGPAPELGIRAAGVVGSFFFRPYWSDCSRQSRNGFGSLHHPTGYVKLSTWSMILREELGGNNRNIICRPPEWQW